LEGLLVAFYLDLNTNSIVLIAMGGGGAAAYTMWRRTTLLGPISIIGAITLISTAAGIGSRSDWITEIRNESPKQSEAGRQQRPAVLHIILDEHIGIEGLPNDDPVAMQLRANLKQYYMDAGFSLYGGAYSEHLHTVTAVPNILNFGTSTSRNPTGGGFFVGVNKYFQTLQQLVYRITVFQSDYADYCRDASVYSCITYDSSAMYPTIHAPMGVSDRARLILFKILNLSQGVMAISQAWNLLTHDILYFGWKLRQPNLYQDASSSSVGTKESLGVLANLLNKAKPGDAYFVHLLLPHVPYVVDRHCNYVPADAWKDHNLRIPEVARQHAYYAQVECTTLEVGRLIRALDGSEAGPNSVIIIHGDHGSRITKIDPNEPNFGRFSTSDVVAGFSTLFAVRVPGAMSNYTSRPQPVAALLGELALSQFKSPPSTSHALRPLQLDNWDWQVRRTMDLPNDWPARPDGPAVVR
jgi:hypothetical protein